jgi:long-chain acyl-CoA synthetase
MKADEHPLNGRSQNLQELVSSLDSRGEDIAVVAFHRHETEQVADATLAHRARQFAGHLVEQMAQVRQPVILLAPPSPDYMAATLGAFWAGAGVVPAGIVPLDTPMPDTEALRRVLSLSRYVTFTKAYR